MNCLNPVLVFQVSNRKGTDSILCIGPVGVKEWTRTIAVSLTFIRRVSSDR